MNRNVFLPCPRGDGGEVKLFLEPEPGDPLGREGWHVWIWQEPGPRGGGSALPHCSTGHRFRGNELRGVLHRAVSVYEAYLAQGGGLIAPLSPEATTPAGAPGRRPRDGTTPPAVRARSASPGRRRRRSRRR